MLTSEPFDPERRRPTRPRTPGVIALLTVVAVIVIILRHDYWNWNTPHPLLFGFLPAGLWWQAMVSILACAMMWMMVRFAWPGELEDEALKGESRRLHDEPPAAAADDEGRKENNP